ncbi:MAG: hypothetical protein E6772_16695 [Dysgonomonas sp.]|nr:hypothetical protein [Dysgonomonas sp.]
MNKQYKHIFSIDHFHSQEAKMLKYLNRMQREVLLIDAHSCYIVAARGTGKSEGIDAVRLLRNIWSMPGSTGGLISPSYSKAWGNTLPAICKALAEWGYIQGIHYFVGRKAPESAGFKQPKRPPLRDGWANCIHFWNGTVLVVLSFAQGMSANSMSLDWLIGPEAKFLNYDKIKSEINPANRGNNKDFGYSPLHHSVMYTTDMPTSKMGRWILEKDKDMRPEHIRLIKHLYKEWIKYKQKGEKTDYVLREIRELKRDLDIARKFQKPVIPIKGKKREYTVFYGEYDVLDNLEVLGEDFIWEMYRDSPALIWRTAFLNERLLKIANGFYSALDDDKHFYIPNDPSEISLMGYDYTKQEESCLADYDLNMDGALHIAFDSNAAISSVAIGQPNMDNRELKTIKSMFVKTPLKLQDLVNNMCRYYIFKPIKEVVFYYDHTFTWTTGTNPESYADTVIKYFEMNGWSVTPVYIGQQPKHEWRHEKIDLALKGDPDYLYPSFNLLNNEYLKIAMEQTGIKQGKDGFEKDKSPEKLPDSPEYPDETKTHITDAWDTLFVGTNFFYTEPYQTSGGVIFLGRD